MATVLKKKNHFLGRVKNTILEKDTINQIIYKKHKNDGINITTEIIQKNDYLNSWLQILNSSKKKDDLADAFLQGIWFLKNSEKIRLSGYEIERKGY